MKFQINPLFEQQSNPQIASDIVVEPGEDYSTIQEGIDSLPATGGTVFVSSGIYPIGQTIQLRDNLNLIFSAGARLELDAGVTCLQGSGVTNVAIIGPNIDLKKNLYTGQYHGIKISENSSDIQVIGSIIQNASENGFGILVANSENLIIAKNRILEGDYSGIRLEEVSIAQIISNLISNHTLPNSFGIASISSNQLILQNNFVMHNGYDGIYLYDTKLSTITNNFCRGNSRFHPGDFSGIRLFLSSYNSIENNICFDDAGSKTQKYGIDISTSTCLKNLVMGNWLIGNQVSGIHDLGTDTVIGTNVA